MTVQYSTVQCTVESLVFLNGNTVESLTTGHFRADSFALCKGATCLGGSKCIGTTGRKYSGPQALSFVERLSIFL